MYHWYMGMSDGSKKIRTKMHVVLEVGRMGYYAGMRVDCCLRSSDFAG